MEEKLKIALANLDRIVANTQMTRAEHLQLISDLELVQDTCKASVEFSRSVEEPEGDNNE